MFELKCDICGRQIVPVSNEREKVNCAKMTIEDYKYIGDTDFLSDMDCDLANVVLCSNCIKRLREFFSLKELSSNNF